MKAMYRWWGIGVLLLCGGCAPVTIAPPKAAPPAAKKFQVDTRCDFGGFHEAGKWYKGNLHCHTTISDGKLDPQATVALYRKLGYDFVALTDHIGGFRDKKTKIFKPLIYPLAQLNRPDFLVLPGMEYDTNRSGETIHMLAIGPGYDQVLEEGQDLSEAMKNWWDKGAFTFFAHPHWSLNSTSVLEDLTFLPAVEVFNYATALSNGLRGNSQLHWDRLLRRSRRVLGVATDDTHRPAEQAGGGWVMVKAPALTADEIVRALRAGRFYFSSGPTLDDVFFDTEGALHVRCSPVEVVRALSTVGKVMQVKAKPGRTLREAVIAWDWNPKGSKTSLPFVRVECTDAHGRTAWTQAVMKRTKE